MSLKDYMRTHKQSARANEAIKEPIPAGSSKTRLKSGTDLFYSTGLAINGVLVLTTVINKKPITVTARSQA
jgi:hypothetical protein